MKIVLNAGVVLFWCLSLCAYPDDFDRWINAKKGIVIDIVHDTHNDITGEVAGFGERLEAIFDDVGEHGKQRMGILWEIDPDKFDGEDVPLLRATLQGVSTDIIDPVGYFLMHKFFKQLRFIPVDCIRSKYASDYYEIMDEYIRSDKELYRIKLTPEVGEEFIATVKAGIATSIECQEIQDLLDRVTDSDIHLVMDAYGSTIKKVGKILLQQIEQAPLPMYNDFNFRRRVDAFFCTMMNFEVLLKVFGAYSQEHLTRFVLYVGGEHARGIGDYLECNFEDFEYIRPDAIVDRFAHDNGVLDPEYLRQKFLEDPLLSVAGPAEEDAFAPLLPEKHKATEPAVGAPDPKRKK